MTTPATLQKRDQLVDFVQRKLVAYAPVQAVVGVGSIATGVAHAGSDIDAVVFLEPFDPYTIPAESIWRASDDTFHSIFTEDEALEREGLQLDFKRLDLHQWRDPAFSWSEPMRAELGAGWTAYDRTGEVTRLITERTTYSDAHRLAQLDDAIVWLDQLLDQEEVAALWTRLGPAIAHDRLQSAYTYLVQALFAYNRRWRIWRNREMTVLLQLPWLPEDFERRVVAAMVAPDQDYSGYLQRAALLHGLFQALLQQLSADGLYGEQPIDEAFVRSHEEPGRAWNMDAWNVEHDKRYPAR